MRFNIGKMDFLTPKAALERISRNEFVLVKDFTILLPNHQMLTIKEGFKLKFFRSFRSMVGDHVEAAIVHNYYCKNPEIDAKENARIFYMLMRRYDIPKWKAKLMYHYVKYYAQRTGEWDD